MSRNLVVLISTVVICVTLITVVALVMGHNGMLATGVAVPLTGLVTTIVAGKVGGVLKEKKIQKVLKKLQDD